MEGSGALTMGHVTTCLYKVKVINGISNAMGEAEDNIRLRLPTNRTETFYDNQDAPHVIIARQSRGTWDAGD
jgi:hypothetical protein